VVKVEPAHLGLLRGLRQELQELLVVVPQLKQRRHGLVVAARKCAAKASVAIRIRNAGPKATVREANCEPVHPEVGNEVREQLAHARVLQPVQVSTNATATKGKEAALAYVGKLGELGLHLREHARVQVANEADVGEQRCK
jgi:hypothetical protein